MKYIFAESDGVNGKSLFLLLNVVLLAIGVVNYMYFFTNGILISVLTLLLMTISICQLIYAIYLGIKIVFDGQILAIIGISVVILAMLVKVFWFDVGFTAIDQSFQVVLVCSIISLFFSIIYYSERKGNL